jgi:acetolactate synthase I/II/III large subunit
MEFGMDSLFESLTTNNVDCVFGCDAEAFLPESCKSEVRYVQLTHEQSAVHAADGYARATGKPGVVLLSSASGVTNAVTGIATASSDSVPLVIFAGTLVDKPLNEAFQAVDISGITMPITKHIFKINKQSDLATIVQQAISIAISGRPGPVLIEITAEAVPSDNFIPEQMTFSENKTKNLQKSIELAAKYLETARKPVLFIGGGAVISGASKILTEIAHKTRIPVVSSLLGIGAIDATDPLYLGMLGMHGTYAANKAVHHSDLLICIGVRFSDRATGKISGFSPKSKKIHVDIDPSEINKIIPVDLPIVSDATEFLTSLKDQLNYGRIRGNTEIWVNESTEWKRTVPLFDKSNSLLSPHRVIRMLNEYSNEDAIVVTDVGQHQMWTAHNYKFTKPRTLVTSGGLGTMGYGLPAAIGVAAANVTKQVICISGDGSFQMNLRELMTAVKYQLPIKIAIMNNGYLGMVRQWQELFYDGRYSAVKMTSPDFVKLAQAYGAAGYKARSEDEAQQVISEAFRQSGPVVMEFDVVEEENVYPMVPPNHSNDQVILSRQ